MSERIELGGGTVIRVLSAEESATLLELELQPGAGAGAHKHTREDETIAVVSGTLLVDDGERRILRAGEAIFLARGVRHSFANEGDEPVRAHISCTPAGSSARSRPRPRKRPQQQPSEPASPSADLTPFIIAFMGSDPWPCLLRTACGLRRPAPAWSDVPPDGS